MSYGSIKLTKQKILDKVSEEEIFEYYLNLKIELKKSYRNPLRSSDDSPGCGFYIDGNKLRFKDFAWGFNEDCFGTICYKFNCGFYQALERIASDFNLYGYGNIKLANENRLPKIIFSKEQRHRTQIEIKEGTWTSADINYWRSQGFNSTIIDFYNVKVVAIAWLSGNSSPYYTYRNNDPCYAYRFYDRSIKLYFPLRGKGQSRFLTNSSVLQGYEQLPRKGEDLIITKSYKDIMAMRMFGIYSVAPQAESSIIGEIEFLELQSRFNNIYSLYDWDRTGIRGALKMKKEYNIKPLFFTKRGLVKVKYDFEVKDFTDNLKLNGYLGMLDIINHTKYNLEVQKLVNEVREELNEDFVPF